MSQYIEDQVWFSKWHEWIKKATGWSQTPFLVCFLRSFYLLSWDLTGTALQVILLTLVQSWLKGITPMTYLRIPNASDTFSSTEVWTSLSLHTFHCASLPISPSSLIFSIRSHTCIITYRALYIYIFLHHSFSPSQAIAVSFSKWEERKKKKQPGMNQESYRWKASRILCLFIHHNVI